MYALIMTIVLSNGVILQDVPETYMKEKDCKKEAIHQTAVNKGGTITFKCEYIRQDKFPSLKKG